MTTFSAIARWFEEAKPITDFFLQFAISVGTIGAVWVALRRPKLECRLSLVQTAAVPLARLRLQITNPSSRPATLIKVYWRPKDIRDGTIELGASSFLNGTMRPFPVTIAEGQFVEITYDITAEIANRAQLIEKVSQSNVEDLKKYISKSRLTCIAVHKAIEIRIPKDVAVEIARRIELIRAPI